MTGTPSVTCALCGAPVQSAILYDDPGTDNYYALVVCHGEIDIVFGRLTGDSDLARSMVASGSAPLGTPAAFAARALSDPRPQSFWFQHAFVQFRRVCKSDASKARLSSDLRAMVSRTRRDTGMETSGTAITEPATSKPIRDTGGAWRW